MADLLELRYPLEFQANCPWVHFTPKKYEFPYGDQKSSEVKTIPYNNGVIRDTTLYLPGSFKETSVSTWGLQNVIGGPETGVAAVGAELMRQAKESVGAKIASSISASTGNIAMPMDLLVYEGPQPIKLNFSFTMIAVSSIENQTIQQIVQNFKKAGNPSKKGTTGALNTLIYPPIWDIDFQDVEGMGYGDTGAYKWMALESATVGYSGESNMHVYADKMPAQVTLDLTFQSVKKFQD